MTTMTISPIQPTRSGYLTKREFDSFRNDVHKHFDEQKSFTNDGFNKVFTQIDEVEKSMSKRFDQVDHRFGEQKKYMDEGFAKVFKHVDSAEEHLSNRIGDMKVDMLNRIGDVKADMLNIIGDVRYDMQQLDIKVGLISKTINKIAEVLKV